VTLYFNGQRLLKNEHVGFDKAAPSAVAIDVTSLVRAGNNSVAVALSRPDAEARDVRVAVGLQTAEGKTVGSALAWKQTTSTPPVGWQQTDFNDRDWQAAQPATQLDFASVPADSVRTVSAVPVRTEAAGSADGFEFVEGDHVVLLGATFFERAQTFGHLEATISAMAGQQQLTFRNLGWSADTVWAESRGIFDTPAQGYQRMIEHVRAEEPTVIIIGYGQNEAIQNGVSSEALQNFREQLTRLIADVSTTGARIVLVSPHALLPAVAPVPSPDRFNDSLQQYTAVLKQAAADLNCSFVSVFDPTHQALWSINSRLAPNSPLARLDISEHPDMWQGQLSEWSDNGMHWNDAGYERISCVVAERLFERDIKATSIVIDAPQKQVSATDGRVRNVRWSQSADELLRLEFQQQQLSPIPTTIKIVDAGYGSVDGYTVSLSSDFDGHHAVELLNGRQPVDAEADQTFLVHSGEYEALRQLVVAKNELYFHRWRPQNITYLFGFRKHEQGNNASEIARFDPLVDQLETQIHSAQQPGWITIIVKKSPSTQKSR
jgi:lysophospholipase L1-like esterase